MSNFVCNHCEAACIDIPGRGYISGCDHYPLPDYPGPTIGDIWRYAKEEYGAHCPETILLNSLIRYFIAKAAGKKSKKPELSDEQKMLLLFISEAWRWRRLTIYLPKRAKVHG